MSQRSYTTRLGAHGKETPRITGVTANPILGGADIATAFMVGFDTNSTTVNYTGLSGSTYAFYAALGFSNLATPFATRSGDRILLNLSLTLLEPSFRVDTYALVPMLQQTVNGRSMIAQTLQPGATITSFGCSFSGVAELSGATSATLTLGVQAVLLIAPGSST